jgi:glycosyltransferase involved in cell wall biosynthesis
MYMKEDIILVGPAHPYRGGLAAFNERLARELISRGHKVVVYTFTLQYPSFLFPGKSQFSTSAAPADIPIVRRLHALNPFNWLLAGWELRRRKPRLVLAAYWLPLLAPCLGTVLRIARTRHSSTAALVHNMLPHEKRPGDRLLSRYFAGSVNAFLALSASVATDISSFCSQKHIAVVPHPVYDSYGDAVGRAEALAHLGLDPADQYILFFGFIRPYKGLDILLRALSAPALADNTKLRLIIAGEFYESPASYHELVDSLGIQDRVIFRTDYIPDEEVRYYFGAADLVVQPYRTATQSGISQLACHFGVPMVVSSVGGLAEIVPNGQAGYVVEGNERAVAAAIADFYAQARAESFRAGVQQIRQRYTWAALAEEVEKMLPATEA